MLSVSKKLISLLFVLAFAFFQFATPASAASYGDNNIQRFEEFVDKCLFSQPDTGVEEVACDVGKTVATASITIGACYVADGMATGIFPPAASLAPLCNLVGVAGSGQQAVKSWAH
jgi:hypothetical protein